MGWFWNKDKNKEKQRPKLFDEDQAYVDMCLYVRNYIMRKWDEVQADDWDKRDYVTEVLLRKYWEMQDNRDQYRIAVRAFQVLIPELICNPMLWTGIYKDMLQFGFKKGWITEDQAIDAGTVMVGKWREKICEVADMINKDK